jgi:hypothetical protein
VPELAAATAQEGSGRTPRSGQRKKGLGKSPSSSGLPRWSPGTGMGAKRVLKTGDGRHQVRGRDLFDSTERDRTEATGERERPEKGAARGKSLAGMEHEITQHRQIGRRGPSIPGSGGCQQVVQAGAAGGARVAGAGVAGEGGLQPPAQQQGQPAQGRHGHQAPPAARRQAAQGRKTAGRRPQAQHIEDGKPHSFRGEASVHEDGGTRR